MALRPKPQQPAQQSPSGHVTGKVFVIFYHLAYLINKKSILGLLAVVPKSPGMLELARIFQGQLSMPMEKQSFHVNFADTTIHSKTRGTSTKQNFRISGAADIVSPY